MTGILLAHPRAFGSGELKSMQNHQGGKDLKNLVEKNEIHSVKFYDIYMYMYGTQQYCVTLWNVLKIN